MKKIIFFSLLLYTSILFATEINIAAFNIEASDADDTVIAQQITSVPHTDIWAIEESTNKYAQTILQKLREKNPNFTDLLGKSGNNMRLQLFYNNNKVSLLNSFELDEINPQNRVRSPLVALFKEKKYNKLFYVMVNHLYRSNPEARLKQARQINQWAQQQNYPIIAVGDYNFDLNPQDPTKHDAAFDKFIENNIFTWAKPIKLIPTQCSRYNDILDFIFISSTAKKWLANSEILFPQKEYCPDTHQTSDHRPVTASFNFIS